MNASVETGEIVGTMAVCGVLMIALWAMFFRKRRVRLYQVVSAVLLQGFLLALATLAIQGDLLQEAFLQVEFACFLLVGFSVGIALNVTRQPGAPSGWPYFLVVMCIPAFCAPMLLLGICLMAGTFPKAMLGYGYVLEAIFAAPFAAMGLKVLGLWKPA